MTPNWWIVTVHDGSGSMVEAAVPRLAFIVLTEIEAQAVQSGLNGALEDADATGNYWSAYFEATPPPSSKTPPRVTDPELQSAIPSLPDENHSYVDCSAIIKKLLTTDD